jgi:hypothetical protein
MRVPPSTGQCRPGQICAHRLSAGLSAMGTGPYCEDHWPAEMGRCLDERPCTSFTCSKDWSCLKTLHSESVCAPDGIKWEMFVPKLNGWDWGLSKRCKGLVPI